MSAAELGGMSPADVHELFEAWKARERRADMRAGQICRILAESHRDRKQRAWPYEAADFFPSLETVRRESPSDEEMEAKLSGLAGG